MTPKNTLDKVANAMRDAAKTYLTGRVSQRYAKADSLPKKQKKNNVEESSSNTKMSPAILSTSPSENTRSAGNIAALQAEIDVVKKRRAKKRPRADQEDIGGPSRSDGKLYPLQVSSWNQDNDHTDLIGAIDLALDHSQNMESGHMALASSAERRNATLDSDDKETQIANTKLKSYPKGSTPLSNWVVTESRVEPIARPLASNDPFLSTIDNTLGPLQPEDLVAAELGAEQNESSFSDLSQKRNESRSLQQSSSDSSDNKNAVIPDH